MQYKTLNIPVPKDKYQHKNIYFSTKILISVQKYLFQYKNTYFSTKIFISVPKYIFQSKNIYFSTKKSFPKSINISQVSLRPAARQQKESESFKMVDLNGYLKRSNHFKKSRRNNHFKK